MHVGQFALVAFLMILAGCQAESNSDNCWKLIFRGKSGIGQRVYTAWTKSSPANCTLANGCIPDDVDLTVTTAPNNTHLKHPIVANWTKINITRVKLEFHTTKRVMYMIFNGTGTTYTNWFSKNRLLESSFDDLYSDGCLKVFTLTGHYAREYEVAQESYSCSTNYYWWMAIVDYKYSSSSINYRCSFELHDKYPVFVYAPKNHKSRFNHKDSGGYLTADAMSIYIKTA